MKLRIYGVTAVVAVLALWIPACRSAGNFPPDDPAEVDISLDRIDRLLAEGKNLRALPLILARMKTDQEEGRYEIAIEGMAAAWEASRSDGDWRQSLVYRRSFSVLEEEGPWAEVSETELFLQGVTDYLDRDLPGAAAALLQSEIDTSNLPADKAEELVAAFSESGLLSVTNDILRSLGRPPEVAPPTLSDMVDGTVTVWVNRGIRLVDGVGIPDRGIGSGFFVDPDGYVLTNYHVIESEVDPSYQGYSRLYIKKDDESGERIPAKVVGWDKNFDLALLKTEMPVPHTFSFAGNDVPELGETVYAIGSPGGLTRTLTSGTVSAYARSIQPMAGSLQIDVPINPGNSGGPLLNGAGEVIGVVFAGIEQFEGINFAIPGPYARRLLPELFDEGRLVHSWIGAVGYDAAGRVEVIYVVPGSPAAEAGIRPGDIIESVDRREVRSVRQIQEYLLGRTPGTLTRIAWRRDTESSEGIVSLRDRPDSPLSYALTRDAREHLLAPVFGMNVERVSGSGLYKTYRVDTIYPGSIADEAGFTVGDTLMLRKWYYEEEFGVVIIQLVLRGRKAGFLESAIQIAAFLEVNTVF